MPRDKSANMYDDSSDQCPLAIRDFSPLSPPYFFSKRFSKTCYARFLKRLLRALELNWMKA